VDENDSKDYGAGVGFRWTSVCYTQTRKCGIATWGRPSHASFSALITTLCQV